MLTNYAPTLQNGQTHSNNSLAICFFIEHLSVTACNFLVKMNNLIEDAVVLPYVFNLSHLLGRFLLITWDS